MVGFFIKLPLYGLHTWLPKAHVEAPSVGSALLAGLLLKLGGFGILRFVSLCVEHTSILKIVVTVSFIGLLMVGVLCYRLMDLKVLIAYSSVVHMRLIGGVCLIPREFSYLGVVLVMVGHGFISAGLFLKLDLYYSAVGSRKLLLTSGFFLNMGLGAFV